MNTKFELQDFFDKMNISDKIPVALFKMSSTDEKSKLFVKLSENKHYNTSQMACYNFYKPIY